MEGVSYANVTEMIERIKDIICKYYDRRVFDKDVAEVLRMTNMNLATMKRRNRPPVDNILAFCYRTGLNPFSILLEQGSNV